MSVSGQAIVVKIGGSTLGSNDTTLHDLATLQAQGARVVVVHGGGKSITDWLKRFDQPSRFVDGVRVTDAQSLEVAVAVMGGLINAELVAGARAAGARAFGLCGVDGGLFTVRPARAELGFVGEVVSVDRRVLDALLDAGFMPLIAPIGSDSAGQLYNINADTAAGEIAVALRADRLVFLTDVAGLLDKQGATIPRLTPADVAPLRDDGTIGGGMVPKVSACLRAVAAGGLARMVDGRVPSALLAALEDESGTVVSG